MNRLQPHTWIVRCLGIWCIQWIRYENAGQVASVLGEMLSLELLDSERALPLYSSSFCFHFFFSTINKYSYKSIRPANASAFQQYRITHQRIGCEQISGYIQMPRLKCDTSKPQGLRLKRFHPSKSLVSFMRTSQRAIIFFGSQMTHAIDSFFTRDRIRCRGTVLSVNSIGISNMREIRKFQRKLFSTSVAKYMRQRFLVFFFDQSIRHMSTLSNQAIWEQWTLSPDERFQFHFDRKPRQWNELFPQERETHDCVDC